MTPPRTNSATTTSPKPTNKEQEGQLAEQPKQEQYDEEEQEQEQQHVNEILKNRVPEVTIVFWIIKVLSTTTGETFADYLNETVGLGLPHTTYIMLSIWIVAMVAQFMTKRYNAFIYWIVVVLISIVGTLITDNLTDGLGLELWISTLIFAVLLAVTFSAWYYKERTLSFHTIFTRRREAFYWTAIMITFALGTAAGDLITEGLGLGYVWGTVLFASLIAAIAIAWKFFKVNAVLCFWGAYILTRPLGASIGDLISQDKSDGGLGLGTTTVSIVFLVLITLLVTYLHIKVTRERLAVEKTIAAAAEKDRSSTQVGKTAHDDDMMEVDEDVP